MFTKHIVALLLLICLGYQPSFASQNQTVKILTLDWTSQIVLSYITGQLLKEQGVEVEYVSRQSSGQWYFLTTNQAHIQIETWPNSLGNKFHYLVDAEKIIDGGTHPVNGREEWWYPLFVKELCPGLPDWRALNRCAHIFADEQTSPKGRFVSGQWLSRESARIRALELDFKAVIYQSGDAIFEQLKRAVAEKKPIVMHNWSPNWTDVYIPGEFVEFPLYDPKCETAPQWGLSNKWLWDCGNPKSAPLNKAVALQLPQISPCAFAIVQTIGFTRQDLSETAYWVDIDGISYQDAATRWLDSNPHRWQNWLNHPTICK